MFLFVNIIYINASEIGTVIVKRSAQEVLIKMKTPQEIINEVDDETEKLIVDNVLSDMKFINTEVFIGGDINQDKKDEWKVLAFTNNNYIDIFVTYTALVPLSRGTNIIIYYVDNSNVSVVPNIKKNEQYYLQRNNSWLKKEPAPYSGVRINGYENLLAEKQKVKCCAFYRLDIDNEVFLSSDELKIYVEHKYVMPKSNMSFTIIAIMVIAVLTILMALILWHQKKKEPQKEL